MAVVVFAVVLWLRYGGRSNFSDFDQLWVGARALLSGLNPYAVAPTVGYQRDLMYPLPAELVAVPFAVLPMEFAHATFAAIGAFALAYVLWGISPWALLAMLSFAVTDCIQLGQWSMLTASIAGLPWLGWLVVVKPTTATAVALAYLVHPFTDRVNISVQINAAVATLLLVVSFLLVPTWLGDWLNALGGGQRYQPLVLYPGGFLLLLGALRWRRPEARLLVALACVPQAVALYEAVPLALVVRTRREAMVMVAGSLVARLLYPPQNPVDEAAMFRGNWPVMALCLYLPALVMVLRRPNASPS